ncbi:ATP-binding protein [Shimia ponticola]|uniref:ATP-binding protein n=1 Tax=Shimia ponticola TaxID=2582893 RepID=UPI0011BD4D12|nr:ATP-binding protein [Shimia ponticola]
MMFRWLKNYMPRGLYWRAALILLLPFLALQIIVSVVFIQRHFEDVTRQMTENQMVVIEHVLDVIDDEGLEIAQFTAGDPLNIDVARAADAPSVDRKLWYDISGITIINRLRRAFDVQAIDLTTNRRVILYLNDRGQDFRVEFPRRTVSARNPHQLLVLMVLTGLFMSLISFAFLRNQLRPIKRLARASEAFGRGRVEDYSPSGAVEVRAAGNAFLDMRNRIERQIEQRTLLLSGVSHDLRTPLTRLQLGLAMMPDDAEVKDLRSDVDDMRQMIDAFLEFAREGAEDEPVPTDVIDLVNDAVDMCETSDNPVTRIIPDTSVSVAVRPTAIKRAVGNLVSNGLKYGTNVRVSIIIHGRSVVIRIEDDGPGIPASDRAAAVRPFTRLDAARNQNQGGSVGLGLAIVTDIARQHGGSLSLSKSSDLGGLRADLVLAR